MQREQQRKAAIRQRNEAIATEAAQAKFGHLLEAEAARLAAFLAQFRDGGSSAGFPSSSRVTSVANSEGGDSALVDENGVLRGVMGLPALGLQGASRGLPKLLGVLHSTLAEAFPETFRSHSLEEVLLNTAVHSVTAVKPCLVSGTGVGHDAGEREAAQRPGFKGQSQHPKRCALLWG